jgi:hypothetical protein
MAHLSSQKLVTFFCLLTSRYVEEDPMHQAIVYACIGTLTAGGNPPDFMIDDDPEIDFVGADDGSRGGKGCSHSIPVGRMNMGGQILENNARRSWDAPKVKRPIVHS